MDVLKDKKYRSYDKLSRYSIFPYYYHTLDDKYIYGTTSHLSDDNLYTLYTVKQNDTWDKIALDAYNNPVYYWIICDFNGVQDPFLEPAVGLQIKIPVLSTIHYRRV